MLRRRRPESLARLAGLEPKLLVHSSRLYVLSYTSDPTLIEKKHCLFPRNSASTPPGYYILIWIQSMSPTLPVKPDFSYNLSAFLLADSPYGKNNIYNQSTYLKDYWLGFEPAKGVRFSGCHSSALHFKISTFFSFV